MMKNEGQTNQEPVDWAKVQEHFEGLENSNYNPSTTGPIHQYIPNPYPSCPGCGRCQYCGRPNYGPSYPQPYMPTWYYSTQTTSIGQPATQNFGGGIAGL